MTTLFATLRELCNAFGPPGFEGEVRNIVRNHIEPLADSLTQSPLGNLLAIRQGTDQTKTLLIDAHMDEVGLIITHVDENGFLHFAPIGGIDPRVIPSHRIQVRGRDGAKHIGVVGVLPPHVTNREDWDKAFSFDDLFIDLGCETARDVAALGIGVGAPAVIHAELSEIDGGCITSKALDDRAGCALLINLLQSLKKEAPPINIIASFTTQEEVGGFGAQTLAGIASPEVALALEGTTATDTPGVVPHKVACAMRKGGAITLADAKSIVPEKLVRFIEQIATDANIPFQLKTPRIGGTNAAIIQAGGKGVLTGILSVPCRYIHSSTSVLNLRDLNNTSALLHQFVQRSAELWDNK